MRLNSFAYKKLNINKKQWYFYTFKNKQTSDFVPKSHNFDILTGMTSSLNTQIISKLEKNCPGYTRSKMIVSFESVNFRRANPVAHISNLLADALPGLKVFTWEAALVR